MRMIDDTTLYVYDLDASLILMIMVGKDAEESKPLAVLGRRSEKPGGEDACKSGYKEKLS